MYLKIVRFIKSAVYPVECIRHDVEQLSVAAPDDPLAHIKQVPGLNVQVTGSVLSKIANWSVE